MLFRSPGGVLDSHIRAAPRIWPQAVPQAIPQAISQAIPQGAGIWAPHERGVWSQPQPVRLGTGAWRVGNVPPLHPRDYIYKYKSGMERWDRCRWDEVRVSQQVNMIVMLTRHFFSRQ